MHSELNREANREIKPSMNEDLTRPILWSTVFHLLLVFLFAVKSIFWAEKQEPYQAAIKVDIIGLPDKVVTPPEPPPSLPQPLPSPPTQLPQTPPTEKVTPTHDVQKSKPKEPELVLKPQKNEPQNIKTSEAIEKIRKKMAIDKIKEEIKNQEREEISQKVSQRITQFKGNVLSPGTELTGINKLQNENYLIQLDRHVKNFWSLPEWLARGNFKSRIRIFIDSHGLMINTQVVEGSGNAQYDDIVLETVKKAVPYPIPPEKLQERIRVLGVDLEFTK